MGSFTGVKATEVLLCSGNSKDQKNEENVVFHFKEIKRVDREVWCVPEAFSSPRGHGEEGQKALGRFTKECGWPGRTEGASPQLGRQDGALPVEGAEGSQEGHPESGRRTDNASGTCGLQHDSSQISWWTQKPCSLRKSWKFPLSPTCLPSRQQGENWNETGREGRLAYQVKRPTGRTIKIICWWLSIHQSTGQVLTEHLLWSRQCTRRRVKW